MTADFLLAEPVQENDVSAFHPDLAVARFIPRFSMGPLVARLSSLAKVKGPPATEDLLIEDLDVPGPDGAPAVPVRLYRPRSLTGDAPALLWIHGGGMILGNHVQDERKNIDFARTLGITVVSVGYRLSPQHPAPAALEDCYAALTWMVGNAEARGIDPSRIAIGGGSAGGGLAAGLALLVHDRGVITPAFQLLVYPMIDDRTTLRTDVDTKNLRIWTPKSNLYGWTSYLGQAPGGEGVSPYAAPARREDLTGLPPAWIGVGTLDLFHDEDVDYAARLKSSGVAVELEIVDGAFHGFDVGFRKTDVAKQFWRSQAHALKTALFPPLAPD